MTKNQAKNKKPLRLEKAVFLDRDGTINANLDDDYIRSWTQFKFLPDAIKGMKILYDAGFKLFVVTNQRGIGLGLMKKSDLSQIHKRMRSELKRHDVFLSDIYYCPHNIEDKCDCRKPKPGMLIKAARDYNLDLKQTFMVGDKEKDIKAGQNAGCKTFKVENNITLATIAKDIVRISNGV